MSFIIEHFSKGTSVPWFWPLHVGVFPASDRTNQILLNGYWSSRLTVIMDDRFKKAFPSHPNLLLFTQGVRDAFALLEKSEWDGLKSNCLLILEPDFEATMTMPDLKDRLKGLTALFDTHGLFILQQPEHLDRWYNHLLVELSHNNSLPEALRITGTKGYFLYDPELDRATKLSSQIPDVIADLRSLISPDFKMPNPWHRDTEATCEDIADFIDRNADRFQYQHENGEGEKLAELNRFRYDVLSQRRQGVEFVCDRDWLKEEIGTSGGSSEIDSSGDGSEDGESSGKPYPPVSPSAPNAPRFLQAGVYDGSDRLQKDLLLTNQIYSISIGIGYPEEARTRGAQSLPTGAVFDDTDSQEEAIQIVFATNIHTQTQSGDVRLPRFGNSTEVVFLFKTPATAKMFKAEITAFHRNRPLQKALLTGYVSDGGERTSVALPGIAMDIVETYRQSLHDLKHRSDFTTSLELSENVRGEMTFRGITENKPIELDFSNALKNLTGEIKGLIEKTVIDIDRYPEDLEDPGIAEILVRLALKGNSLYVDHFRKQSIAEGPIKIVTSKSEFIPLDFMYTKPPPLPDARVCRHAVKALEEGVCRGCPGIEEDPSPVVCPLGFWTFSKVVERTHRLDDASVERDYKLVFEPTADRDTLDILHSTLFASSQKVYARSPDLKEKLLDSLRSKSKAITEAADWKGWKQALADKKDIDSLILLVHIEKDRVTGQDSVEIGSGEFQLINYFNERMVLPKGADSPPLVILLGCESSDTVNFEFDLSNRFLNSGAGIVLSSFTKIRGRQAVPIVMKLVDFLRSRTGSQVSFGEVLLQLRQHLLSKGILSGLSLVCYGDADWKLRS